MSTALFIHQTALMTMFCQPGHRALALQTLLAGGTLHCSCTMSTLVHIKVHSCQCGCVGTLLHSLSIGSHPTHHPQPHQENSLQFHLPNRHSPDMMTHSFGPQVCTFPMVLPAQATLKRENLLQPRRRKTASPVGRSVTGAQVWFGHGGVWADVTRGGAD